MSEGSEFPPTLPPGRFGSLRVRRLLYLIKFYTNVCCLYEDLYDSGPFCLYKVLYVSKVYIAPKVFRRLSKELYVFLRFKILKPRTPQSHRGGGEELYVFLRFKILRIETRTRSPGGGPRTLDHMIQGSGFPPPPRSPRIGLDLYESTDHCI